MTMSSSKEDSYYINEDEETQPNKKTKKSKGVSFQTLNFTSQIYKGIQKIGFKTPTPIQRKALPVVLSGRDCIIMSRTGSGKTATFVLPLLQKLCSLESYDESGISKHNATGIGGVILSPTRELAIQTYRVTKQLSTYTHLQCITILGGELMETQFSHLSNPKKLPHIIIATPGRLQHHLDEIPDFNLLQCSVFILDEADRLFEMGFSQQIYDIYKSCNTACQKVLVSATMQPEILNFCKKIGMEDDPHFIQLESIGVPSELRLGFVYVRTDERDAILFHILQHVLVDVSKKKTLIFVATRYHVEYITYLLRYYLKYSVEMVYGTLDQQARKESLEKFRKGKANIFVTTDVAARGMDIPELDYVVHYHFPSTSKLFIHRSGRVGRSMGRIGYALAILTREDVAYLMDLQVVLGRKVIYENDDTQSYKLQDMKEEDVHFGTVPENVLAESKEILENNTLISSNDYEVSSSLKACENAMIQYRKSRVQPSSYAIKQSKSILNNKEQAMLPIHPLFYNEKYHSNEDYKSREDFLRQMRSFRPKETILEMGKDVNLEEERKNEGIIRLMERRREAILRKQHVVPQDELSGEDNDEGMEQEDESQAPINIPELKEQEHPKPKKVYLSKAQRKRLKQNKPLLPPTATKEKNITTYRDENNYISTDPTQATLTQNQKTQILSQSETKPHAYLTLQQNMLDIVGDENADLVQKHRITRWDKNKRKYVTSTLGLEVDKIGMSSSKKVKLENGTMMKKDKLKSGQLFEKWQKKQKNLGDSIFDDDIDNGDDENNNISIPTNKKNKNDKNEKAKTSAQIAKERKIEQKNKMKYMPKADRKRLIESKKKNERAKEEKEFNRNRATRRRDVVKRQGKLVRRL